MAIVTRFKAGSLLVLLGFLCQVNLAVNAAELTSVDYNVLPGEKVQIRLVMNGAVQARPNEFTTDNPARVVLDFPGVDSVLGRKTLEINVGSVRSVTAVSAQGRTRVVVNMVTLEPYFARQNGNDYLIVVGQSPEEADAMSFSSGPVDNFSGGGSDGGGGGGFSPELEFQESDGGGEAFPDVDPRFNNIRNVDFRRGPNGEGQVILQLSQPNSTVDLRQEGKKVIADFMESRIPEGLIRRIDVMDFATPAQFIDTSQQGGMVRVIVEADGDYEYLAYQADELFTIELKPLSDVEVERRKKDDRFKYTGEKVSFGFQDIEVRLVLQMIAEFTNLNIVISDTVTGNITLRLQNVPWDQVLDIVLRTKGLDKRREGDVIYVAPAKEIAAREAAELKAMESVEKLAPLRTEYIQVNYAKAKDIVSLLQSGEASLMSNRGSVAVDERTNTLLVQDTASKLEEIRDLVNRLDIPVRQVLIESRIVTADDGFVESMGVRFGVSDAGDNYGFSGTALGAESIRETNTAPLANRLNVNLPVIGASANPGTIGINIARLADGTILDLELSALETENRGEVIASPRVITVNQREAYIEQGVEIPFQSISTAGGAATAAIEFKKAVLSLRVTPQITPDDRVIMDLQVNQDTQGEDTDAGPAINTQEVGTQVLVSNGETVVLGGIYQRELVHTVNKVPLLGDLPLLGMLFRNTVNRDNKRELLIFVTPKILKQSF